MPQLIKKPEIASGLVDFLERQKTEGFAWVVYDTDNAIASSHDLHCFATETEAFDFAKDYQKI